MDKGSTEVGRLLLMIRVLGDHRLQRMLRLRCRSIRVYETTEE
jgi:hypothetical protein